MAFPTVSLLDSFKRAEEKPLSNGAKWLLLETVLEAGSSAANEIGEVFGESYRAEAAFATKRANAYWKVTEFSNPNVVATVHVLVGNERFYYLYGSVAKIGVGKFNGYRVLFKGEATAGKYEVAVQKFKESGAFETLASKKEVTLTVSNLIGLSVEGGKVKAWHKPVAGAWETIAEAADATYNKGFVGIGMGGNEGRLQNFEAGSGSSHKEVETFTASLTPEAPIFKKQFNIKKTLTAALTFNGQLIKVQKLFASLSFAMSLSRTAETTKFPAVTLIDNFAREENPLNNGGKWTIMPSGIAPGAHIGKAEGGYTSVDPKTSGFDGAYWNAQTFKAPMAVAGGLSPGSGAGFIPGIVCCFTTTEGGNGYALTFNPSGLAKVEPTLSLVRYDKGVSTNLKSEKLRNVFKWGISVVNGQVTAWKKETSESEWEVVFGVHDTTYSTGFVGVIAQGEDSVVEEIEAGTTITLKLIAELFGRVGDETPTVGKLSTRLIKVFQAALTFAGAIGRNTTKKLSAELTFAGALRKTKESFQAALSFAGALPRTTTHGLSGSLSFVGALPRNIVHALSGTLTFLGSLELKRELFIQVLEATLDFAGALPRKTTHALSATLETAGSLGRSVTHPFQATASFEGTLPRNISRRLSASLGPEGELDKAVSHALAATLSFVGSLQGSPIKNFEAALDFATELPRNITHQFQAMLSPAGFIKFAGKFVERFSATLDFSGELTKQFTLVKVLEAALEFAGTLPTNIVAHLRATLDFEGALPRNTARSILALLRAEATLERSTFHQLAASLSPAAFLRRDTTRALAASLSFTGSGGRSIVLRLKASLAAQGGLQRAITHGFAATLNLAGGFFKETFVQSFQAALDFSGAIQRTAIKNFHAALRFDIHIPFNRLIRFTRRPDKLTSRGPKSSLTLVAFQKRDLVPEELVRPEPPATLTESLSHTINAELPLPPHAHVEGDEGLEERDQPASVKADLPDNTLTLDEQPNELLLEERDLAHD